MPPNSVNAPDRPALNKVTLPVAGSTRPIAGPPKPFLTNQMLPSAPVVIATIVPFTRLLVNSVICPVGVMRPIRLDEV